MTRREKIQYILVLLADMAALAGSVALCWLIFDVWLAVVPVTYTGSDRLQFYALLLAAFLTAFLCFDQSENIIRRSVQSEIRLSIRFNIIMIAVHAILMLITKIQMLDSRYMFLGIPLFNVFFMLLSHTCIKAYLKRPNLEHGIDTLVGVLTTRERAPALLADLRKDWTKRLHGLAILDVREGEIGQTIDGIPIMATYDGFLDWMRRDALDEVYIDIPIGNGDSLMPYLHELESMGLNIHLNVPLLARLYDDCRRDQWAPRMSKTIEACADTPMVTLSATRLSMTDTVLKRTIDVVGGLVGCLISIPLIAIVAIPLKLESPGPLLFKQKRVGLNGRVFNIYKLRSMYMDAEARKKELMAQNEMNGLMFKMADDPRITKVGKFIRKTSIDELPQFFNVLRGEMSLVGTRPPTLDEYSQYESHHKRRLSMKPGITGLWQVSGRSSIENFEDVVKMDVTYIDHWSLWGDVKILFKTVVVVFVGRGAV